MSSKTGFKWSFKLSKNTRTQTSAPLGVLLEVIFRVAAELLNLSHLCPSRPQIWPGNLGGIPLVYHLCFQPGHKMQHSHVESLTEHSTSDRVDRGSLLSAVRSWVRGLTETFLSGLLGQQSSSDLSLCQLKVDMLLLTTPGVRFHKLHKLNLSLENHLQDPSVSSSALKFFFFPNKTNLSRNCLAKGRVSLCTVSKHIGVCLLDLLLLLHCAGTLITPSPHSLL